MKLIIKKKLLNQKLKEFIDYLVLSNKKKLEIPYFTQFKKNKKFEYIKKYILKIISLNLLLILMFYKIIKMDEDKI